MIRPSKKEGATLAIAGALVGLITAGFKRRQMAKLTAMPDGGPVELSASDWKEVAKGIKDGIGKKNLPTLAAGVAYYSILALFPLMAAAVAISALLITPEQLATLIATAEEYLPANASTVIGTQLENLVSRRSDNIMAAVISLLIAIVSASGASKNLVIASNVTYGVEESRGWLAQQLWGVIWTVAGILFGFLVLAVLAANGSFLERFGVSPELISWILYGRWAITLLVTFFGLALFYKYGPNRPHVRWHWVYWGAAAATIVWTLATLLFFIYVQHFANYTQTYSLFAGIIVLMIWMNLSALIVLLGAEINYRLETAGHSKWSASLRDQ